LGPLWRTWITVIKVLDLDDTPALPSLQITCFGRHAGRQKLIVREKWDEWFRDLAYKIVDVKVSAIRQHKFARMAYVLIEYRMPGNSRQKLKRPHWMVRSLPLTLGAVELSWPQKACRQILASKRVPHWDHPDDIALIRSTLRMHEEFDDVRLGFLQNVTRLIWYSTQ
jgi:hypothetical protein